MSAYDDVTYVYDDVTYVSCPAACHAAVACLRVTGGAEGGYQG